MFQLKLELVYSDSFSKREKTILCSDSFENEDTSLIWTHRFLNEDNNYLEKIVIVSKKEITIHSARLTGSMELLENTRLFMNGFQSWTDSQELRQNERMKNISYLVKSIVRKFELDRYGDYTFVKYPHRKGRFHGFTYGFATENSSETKQKKICFFGSLSEKEGYTIFKIDSKKQMIEIQKDIEGIVISSEYKLFELLFAKGIEETVFDQYFHHMNIPKPKVTKMNGWTSWYNYYENISEDIILSNLEAFSAKNLPIDIFQIDDGYENAVGDWLSVKKDKFPSGMQQLAEQIHKKGYKAGIWLAPFVCETKSEIYTHKKHWLLRDEQGKLVCAGSNWSKFYALDIYHPEVRSYLIEVFHQVLDVWEYDLVKLDFLYAISLISYYNKSRGQIMSEGMAFLRECVKDKMILGCGVPLGPAFGLVDYCRVGCDMGLDWNGTKLMQLLHRERISTYYSIINAINRRHLNNRGFMNDPDVFLLRDDNIRLSNDQKKLLAMVNHIFGSLIFSSDNITTYTKEQDAFFRYIMNKSTVQVLHVNELKKDIIEVVFLEDLEHKVILLNLTKKNYPYLEKNMVAPYGYYLEVQA